ncbi:uncharacterized protein LOC125491061 [Plutella xylostella]|nr:uncharacterized protein LOC105391786 [Plutella xylostella]XP_037969726.1 uncharacterized protein LOC119692642 [Plutella xylostella]XP_048477561.1 uncharacterized protein LOC119691360 [Plutella xylostella]XP_048486892.1 uncharacterized protein LOC119690761 [Plutella xylostella]XP_048487975.1 uncharacterized protein LOC125491061 [Plutella xylostella]
MSDSECESVVGAHVEAAVAAAKKKQTSKRKSSAASTSSSSAPRAQKKKLHTIDIFGLCNDEDEVLAQNKTLPSFVVNRVANGNQRRVANTSGDFYVEVKVYARRDAEDAPKDTRWTKALLRLNTYVEDGSPQWKLLHRFVKEASNLFSDSTPSFYNPDTIKFKEA